MCCRCGNVAAILELDENLNKQFRVFEAAPQVCASNLLALGWRFGFGYLKQYSLQHEFLCVGLLRFQDVNTWGFRTFIV